MTYLRRITLLAGTTSLAIGCWSAGDSGGCAGTPNGLLGQADFTYECVSPADPWCNHAELPKVVATGARFKLTFDVLEMPGVGALELGSPREIATQRDPPAGFAALHDGPFGFVVRDGQERSTRSASPRSRPRRFRSNQRTRSDSSTRRAA